MTITFGGDDFEGKEFSAFLESWKIFSPEEQAEFHYFLLSPYFNKEKRLAELYKRILESHRSGSERINGRPLLKSLFGNMNETNARSQLKRLIRELGELLLEFAAHQELRLHRRTGLRVKTQALKKRKNTGLFQKAAAQLEKLLESELHTLMIIQDEWWNHHQQYFHQNIDQYKPKDAYHLSSALQKLDFFYHVVLLRYYCEILNRRRILGKETAFHDLENRIEPFLQEDNTQIVIAVYSRLARVLQDPADEERYGQFKTYYQENYPMLAKPDQLVLIKTIFNVWIRHYEAGREDGPREMLFWAKQGVDRGIYIFDGTMSDREYLNIAIAAGLSLEFDFLRKFREDYRQYLEDHREEAYQMAEVYLLFFEDDLLGVLRILEKYFPYNSQADHVYTLRAKVFYMLVYLRCCIDNSDGEIGNKRCYKEFESQEDAYRQYIVRTGLLDAERKKPYQRFRKICRSIFKYESNLETLKTQVEKKAILDEIDRPEALIARLVLRGLAERLKAR